jgi:hypothetical protein
MTKKSYWQSVFIGSDNAKEAVKSWFMPLCEGMTPYEADILCDIETDREKKIRARMIDAQGKRRLFERTRGRNFTISVKRITEDSQ